MDYEGKSIIELIKGGYKVFGDDFLKDILRPYDWIEEILYVANNNKIKIIQNSKIVEIDFDRYKKKSAIYRYVYKSIIGKSPKFISSKEHFDFWFEGFSNYEKKEVLWEMIFNKDYFKDEVVDYVMEKYFSDFFKWNELLKKIKSYRKSGMFLGIELTILFDFYFKYKEKDGINKIFEQICKSDILYLIDIAYKLNNKNIKSFLKDLFKSKNIKFDDNEIEEINPLFFYDIGDKKYIKRIEEII